MMMGGGLDGARRIFGGDSSKPKSVGATLLRFWEYFRMFWYGPVIALTLLALGTWTQVTAPDYIGQAVDCYLFQRPGSVCWFDAAATPEMAADARIAGIGSIVVVLLALFVVGSICSGLAFYTMTWTGQHVLQKIRADLFRQLHRLSLGFYAENESGNLMSRITSDTDTLQQVFSFALMSVISGVMLIVWIVIKMLQTNVPYALLSLAVAPVMLFATVYFSGQARKAFRKSRAQMGSVNANLEESISGVREVQAFNREEESIDSFRQTNAANRDANIRAASFTSALNPVLEALGYVAIGIVVVVGGISVL